MECHKCKKYFGNYSYKNNLYCSKCYEYYTGKYFTDYKYDTENEIIDTLQQVYSIDKMHINHIKLQIKKSNNLIVDLPFITKNFFANNIFFMSEDVKFLLKILNNSDMDDEHKKYYNHILCSRIIDYWNINKEDHDIGECYYNGPLPKTINEGIIYFNSNFKSKFMFNVKRCKISSKFLYFTDIEL